MTAAASLRYRFATVDDAVAVAALVESAYRGEPSRAGWTTEADLLDGRRTGADEITALLQQAGSRILLAESDDGLLSSAHLQRHADHAYFGMFAVRPGLQGSGVGRLVLAETERFALHDWQVPEMRMTVIDVREELIAWYERRGYRRTGQHLPFPYGDERFGLPKRPDLRFEVLVKQLGPVYHGS